MGFIFVQNIIYWKQFSDECGCNIQGTESSYCNFFGTTCTCKPNVIGNKCIECNAEYFGFPNCIGINH